VPRETASAVAALTDAGYALVGKTNLHEFAYGTTSENPHFGTVPNPAAPGHVAGGSSGGNAAALVLCEADATLGTDTGGSIRIPSACCGTVGFKPTYGLVPLTGCFPLAPSFDHAGPMARDVAGCIEMMRVFGVQPAATATLGDLAVGVLWLEEADPLVRERVSAAAALVPGARPVELPFPRTSRAFQREVAQVHRELYEEHRELYGDELATKIERCLAVTDDEYAAALRALAEYREQAAALFETVDLLLTPTLPCVAPPVGLGDLALRDRLTRFTFPFNMLGAPAAALPCGAAEDGLPASVQLVGAKDADGLVLAAALQLEAALAEAA
jgi:aspartyl-tRNA(Asn)/glutamyl-tRNA(Gln) amidotransferase subunit A